MKTASARRHSRRQFKCCFFHLLLFNLSRSSLVAVLSIQYGANTISQYNNSVAGASRIRRMKHYIDTWSGTNANRLQLESIIILSVVADAGCLVASVARIHIYRVAVCIAESNELA